jgi:RNA polymerase sigma-70 factor (ECF subfamily)
MDAHEPDTDQLLACAGRGDAAARGRLLERHRGRLRGMVALRLDPRLAARVDPSDLVQETLAEAHRRLDDYLRDRPVPFYPWLRQIAADRLADLHRRHVRSRKRTVACEEPGGWRLADGSELELAKRMAGSVSAPSARLRREDRLRRLRAALAALPERDREVLVLRHLEQMPPREIAAVLGISEGAVYTRHLRALERLRRLLDAAGSGGEP